MDVGFLIRESLALCYRNCCLSMDLLHGSSAVKKMRDSPYQNTHTHALTLFLPIFVVCLLFSKLTFSKNSFRNTFRVSNSLHPDQANRRQISPLNDKELNMHTVLSRKVRDLFLFLFVKRHHSN